MYQETHYPYQEEHIGLIDLLLIGLNILLDKECIDHKSKSKRNKMNIILYFSISIGIFFSVLNFYLSFIDNKENKASGIPIVGSLILFISLFFINNYYLFYIIIIFILMDTGGIHWFIANIVYNNYKK